MLSHSCEDVNSQFTSNVKKSILPGRLDNRTSLSKHTSGAVRRIAVALIPQNVAE
jgi:hypothetical protein